ncbi:hypothetical protein FRC04_006264 [Tulasnella sp. 424]|nr:hypothetical protein FRC04_006264 [Tulasnella sp. 424]
MSGPDYARFMLVDSCMVCANSFIMQPENYIAEMHAHDQACQQKSWTLSFDYFHRVQYLGSDDASLVNHRGRWHGSKRQYHKVTVGEVDKLWKSLSETMDTPTLANTRLMERLQKYADNRIKSGIKMYAWRVAVREWKDAEIAKVMEERKASILAKLLELGHEEIDLPRWHFEVEKSVPLCDEEWERVRPIVERAAESNKSSRLWNQSWRRRNERSRALTFLWNGAVAVATGTRAVYLAERNACPTFNEFLGLPPAADLIAADTDGISAADQDSIRPQAVQFAIQGRRRTLTKLHNILKGLPLDQTNEEEWSSLSNDEAIARLDIIAAELAQAVNGLWDSKRKAVDWYPSTYFRAQYLDLGVLSPAEGLAPGLIARMLESIDKSPDTEAAVVTSWNWGRKSIQFRCARCDERVAPYLTFSDMISHFLEKKVWFDKAELAREKALAENPSLSHHTFFNDHDWNSEGDMIVSETSHDKARVTRLQNQLEAAYGNDPEDYDGEDFTTRSRRSVRQEPQKRTRRICRLCPEGFAPRPMYFATLKIHIEHM